MVYSDVGKILIKNLYKLKGYKVMELMNKLPNKWWTKSSINMLLKKTLAQSTDSQVAADPTKCCTEENVDLVNHLVLSQEDMLRHIERSVKSHMRQAFG